MDSTVVVAILVIIFVCFLSHKPAAAKAPHAELEARLSASGGVAAGGAPHAADAARGASAAPADAVVAVEQPPVAASPVEAAAIGGGGPLKGHCVAQLSHGGGDVLALAVVEGAGR